MRPDAHQETLLERLMDLHREELLQKQYARLEYEKWLAEKLNKIRTEKSRVANQCLESGISKTRIGRAVGTSNWETVNKLIDLTVAERESERKIAAATPPFELSVPKKGDYVLQINLNAAGKVLSPPRKIIASRYQGSDWGNPSYFYFTYADLGLTDVAVLDEIQAELLSAIRANGGVEGAKIQGRPDAEPTASAPSGFDSDGYAVPGSPEWLASIDDDEE